MGRLWDREPPSYQITVYDRDSVTPAWLKQAVVYQIFRTGSAGDRYLQTGSRESRGPDPQHLGRESLLCEG